MDSNKSFHKGNLYIQLLAPGSNRRTAPKGQWCVLPKIGVLAWWWCQGCPKVCWQTPVAYNRKHTSRPETYSVRYFVWLLASVKGVANRSCTSWASLFGSLRSVQCGRGYNRSNKVPTTRNWKRKICADRLRLFTIFFCFRKGWQRWNSLVTKYCQKGISEP